MAGVPQPRGETSEALLEALARAPHPVDLPLARCAGDPVADEDLQLSLYLLYELHYRGLPGVDDDWEWSPSLVALRRALEERFEQAVEAAVGAPSGGVEADEADLALRAIADADEAPSLSRYIERAASVEQLLEFVVHRSPYQLKEADPHSWAIPRLTGPPKAALVEIQADEYGGGRPERIHAVLFAEAMEALGLDPCYGAYVDHVPAVTLANLNLMSMLGLNRRLRGACIGHLALFEMTSSIPNRRYAAGIRRLGFDDPRATAFFDEHVEADAVHEQIAAVDLAGGLIRQDAALAPQVLWGARALVWLEGRWSRALLEAWHAGRSSLRIALADAPAPVSG